VSSFVLNKFYFICISYFLILKLPCREADKPHPIGLFALYQIEVVVLANYEIFFEILLHFSLNHTLQDLMKHIAHRRHTIDITHRYSFFFAWFIPSLLILFFRVTKKLITHIGHCSILHLLSNIRYKYSISASEINFNFQQQGNTNLIQD